MMKKDRTRANIPPSRPGSRGLCRKCNQARIKSGAGLEVAAGFMPYRREMMSGVIAVPD
jgi:hypothetical protein